MGLTLNDRKEIAKRWAEGESAASIATRLGFATGTIYREAGSQFPPPVRCRPWAGRVPGESETAGQPQGAPEESLKPRKE